MAHRCRISTFQAVCGWLVITTLTWPTPVAVAQSIDSSTQHSPQRGVEESGDADIAQAIDDLASKKFRKRQGAFLTLVRSGDAAVDALVSAAKTSHLEVGARCVEALAQIGRDPKGRASALAALERLAGDAPNRIANLAIAEAKKLKTTDQERATAALVAAGVRIQRDSKGNVASVSVARDREIALLHHYPNLRSVRLSGADVTNAGIKSLVGIKQLSSLTLSRTSVTDFGLSQLKELDSLDRLSLYGTLFSTQAMRRLQYVAGLRTLSLHAPADESQLEFLTEVRQIESLYLSETQWSRQVTEVINQLANLKRLSLSVTDTDDRQLHWIAQIEIPLSLSVMRSPQVTVEGWKELSDAKLRGLTVMSTSIDDSGLAHLGQIVSLESLAIYEAPVTDAGLAHLEELKSLRSLRLHKSKVTEEGVARLRKTLPRLLRASVDSG
jgi:hypothetical protein